MPVLKEFVKVGLGENAKPGNGPTRNCAETVTGAVWLALVALKKVIDPAIVPKAVISIALSVCPGQVEFLTIDG